MQIGFQSRIEMVPSCIIAILDPEPDNPDIYRYRFVNNHPFLDRMRIEFIHTEQENTHITSSSRFFWAGGSCSILDTIYRLRGAYDREGE